MERNYGTVEEVKEIIIGNWKEYVVEGTDIHELEEALKKDGWLDEKGNLILQENGVDYRRQFWGKYDVAFNDEILEA